MKKKITALMLVLTMLFCTGVSASFGDVDNTTAVGNAINQLSELGILNGYPDGAFHPNDTLTRAQFAKIAVHMLGEEKSASSRNGSAVFSDVSGKHWASGYVNYIAEKEIINGYPDGTFGAEDTINYAQALTILVRLLGYSGEDVGYKWPEGYITKAKSLGITEGMYFDTYETLTRGNAAYVIYNTLLADKKEGAQVKLLSDSSVEDAVIYGDSEIDASIAPGTVLTTKGSYKLADKSNISSEVYGRLGTIYLDSEGRATAFVAENESVRNITISGAAASSDGNKVEVTYSENGATNTEIFSGSIPLYYEGKSSSVTGAVTELEAGREALLFHNENGSMVRIYLKESSLSGPLTITTGYSQIYSSFDIANSNAMTVIRDGRNSSLSEISTYDVVYYMKGNNTLYVYTDKINGTYEDALPLKSNVKSVIIAGREYALSTQKAINKMNTSQDAFEIGDRVTLLLGRNGEVVDVVDLATMGSLDLAILTKCFKEVSEDVENQGETIHYVNVVIYDGTQVTYKVNTDYSDYVGRVVKVSYDNEVATLSVVKPSVVSGEFNSSLRTLDGHFISDNCSILEFATNSSSEALVSKISLSEIQTTKLGADQVLHAETVGGTKDIAFLYVTDVTMKNVDIGVVVDVGTKKILGEEDEDGDGKREAVTVKDGTFGIMLPDGSVKTARTARNWSNGSVVAIKETSGGTEYKALLNVKIGTAVEGYSNGRIRVNGENFILSDYVKVFGGKDAAHFESMSVSKLVNNEKVKRITLYSDRALNQGGIIRAIVAVVD